MADIGTKISELEAAAALDGTELLVAVQGGQTKKSTAAAVETLVKTGLTASDVGLGNVANERQYSANNPPPMPTPAEIGAVPTSRTINGHALSTDITLDASDVGAEESLTWDNVPTAGSANPVESGGIYDALLKLYPTDTVSGNPANFPDGADDVPVVDLKVRIEPVQDLHGQANPWPAGGGKNKLLTNLANIKAINTDGTWTGNTYVYRGVTFNVLLDDGGNIVGVTASGTATNSANLFIVMRSSGTVFTPPAGEYILNGCPSGGGDSSYALRVQYDRSGTTGTYGSDFGSGVTATVESGDKVQGVVSIVNGYAISGSLTFYPMLRLSSVSDATFAPYSNVCPISGWTGAMVTRTGKNLLPTMETQTSHGATITAAEDGSIRVSGTADSQTSFGGTQFTLAPGEYILSGAPSGSASGSYDLYLRNLKTNAIIARSYDDSTYTNFTLTESTPVQATLRVPQGAMDTAKVFYPMIRFASDEDSTYEPYNGDTYSVSWQAEAGTVYGGTLDVTTGVLTVTNGYIASYAGETLPGEWISDRDVYAAGTSPSTGAQVVYELAEPVAYQLTPTEVKTLLGENNIWADCGPVEAEYRADLEKYIEKKIGDVQALILENI